MVPLKVVAFILSIRRKIDLKHSNILGILEDWVVLKFGYIDKEVGNTFATDFVEILQKSRRF